MTNRDNLVDLLFDLNWRNINSFLLGLVARLSEDCIKEMGKCLEE